MSKLQAILEWKMTQEEIEVYHIAVSYEEEYKRLIKEDKAGFDPIAYKINSVPMRGDPRKSNLFRQCWKLRRETRGLLELHEYKFYIRANLAVINHFEGKIAPNCINGDKSWIRFKVWKRKYDQKLAENNATTPPPSINNTDPKLIAEIDRTKKFIFEKCNGEVSLVKIKNFYDQGFLKLWLVTGKIAPYYFILSPFVAKVCDINILFSHYQASPSLIRQQITSEIEEYFKHEFSFEFKS